MQEPAMITRRLMKWPTAHYGGTYMKRQRRECYNRDWCLFL